MVAKSTAILTEMNYIGSKATLLPFIEKTVQQFDVVEGVFCDIFAGTGVVGAHFKSLGFEVIANDMQQYSYLRSAALLLANDFPLFSGLAAEIDGLDQAPVETRLSLVCDYLNNLEGIKGFVYSNYCLGGTSGSEFERLYFSDDNGQKCDAIRQQIAIWEKERLINEEENALLVAALIEAIDKVANTASVYGAYLKKLKRSASKTMIVEPLPIITSTKKHRVYRQDANQLIRQISGDILYLDPPYNQRQYAANYHVLETIALNDQPDLRGKTGLRDYQEQKSAYCSRSTVIEAFTDLIDNADFRYIALSYNNEGLMTADDVKEIMSSRGRYWLRSESYPRFRADSDSKERKYSGDQVTEYLHCLEVR